MNHTASSANLSLILLEVFSARPQTLCFLQLTPLSLMILNIFPLKFANDGLPPTSCVHAGVSVNMASLCACSIIGVSVDIVSLGIT